MDGQGGPGEDGDVRVHGAPCARVVEVSCLFSPFSGKKIDIFFSFFRYAEYEAAVVEAARVAQELWEAEEKVRMLGGWGQSPTTQRPPTPWASDRDEEEVGGGGSGGSSGSSQGVGDGGSQGVGGDGCKELEGIKARLRELVRE